MAEAQSESVHIPRVKLGTQGLEVFTCSIYPIHAYFNFSHFSYSDSLFEMASFPSLHKHFLNIGFKAGIRMYGAFWSLL